MSNHAATPPRIRWALHLELGRVSNLPTVWSNCIAAWVLVQGDVLNLWVLAHLLLVISLVYVGGMYLNDACDAPFDAEHHPGRPIPSRRIGRTLVYALAFIFLTCGVTMAWLESWRAMFMVIVLVGLIIGYDLHHLRLGWSPVLIAACRAMVYLTIWVASSAPLRADLLLWAVALAAYVIGLSFVAKVEETNALRRYSPVLLLFVPAIVFAGQGFGPDHVKWVSWVVLTVFLAWMGLCLFLLFRPGRPSLKPAVGAMLAGIALVDLLAISQVTAPWVFVWQVVALGLFALALVSQRKVAAT